MAQNQGDLKKWKIYMRIVKIIEVPRKFFNRIKMICLANFYKHNYFFL